MAARRMWPILALLLVSLRCAASSGPPASSPAANPAGASAAVQPTAAGSPAAPAPATVRLAGQATTLSDAGLYIAEARGHFRAQGIVLERSVLNTAEAVPQLAAGQLDALALAPSAGMMNALGRGIPMKIVADKGREASGFAFQSVLVRRELLESGAVRTVADLRGRRVALPALGNPLEASFGAGLAQGGLSIDDVQVELLAFPDIVPALANGSVDVGLVLEPVATEAVRRDAGVRWKSLWEFYPEQQAAVISFGPTLTERAPEVARRFMVAYVQGLRVFHDAFVRGDPDARRDAVQVLADSSRLAPALIEEIAAAGRLPALDPAGRVNVAALRDASAYWRQRGTQTVDLDVDQLVDTQYLDHAARVLGPYPP